MALLITGFIGCLSAYTKDFRACLSFPKYINPYQLFKTLISAFFARFNWPSNLVDWVRDLSLFDSMGGSISVNIENHLERSKYTLIVYLQWGSFRR